MFWDIKISYILRSFIFKLTNWQNNIDNNDTAYHSYNLFFEEYVNKNLLVSVVVCIVALDLGVNFQKYVWTLLLDLHPNQFLQYTTRGMAPEEESKQPTKICSRKELRYVPISIYPSFYLYSSMFKRIYTSKFILFIFKTHFLLLRYIFYHF